MKAKVYFNLHNSKWSIKDCETGLVMGHADKVCLIIVKTDEGYCVGANCSS